MFKKFVYIISLIILSSLLTEILLYSQNTLFRNDNWIIGKRMQKVGLIGADDFLLDRSVLAQNEANLFRHHGFQEIYTKEVFSTRKIKFKFKVPKQSYLDIFIQNDSASNLSRAGFRLSNRVAGKSFSFLEKSEDGFTYKKEFKLDLSIDGWVSGEVSLY